MTEFKIGDRVRFSAKAFERRIPTLKTTGEIGRVTKLFLPFAVQVKWNTIKTKPTYHVDFLEYVGGDK